MDRLAEYLDELVAKEGFSGSVLLTRPGLSAQWWYFPDGGYGVYVLANQSEVAARIAERVRSGISFRK